jgi:hypothetical protein
MTLAVTPDDARFFGTLQLRSEIVPGVGLAVGVRNSIDRSLPIGFCCGQWWAVEGSDLETFHGERQDESTVRLTLRRKQRVSL